jgi:hypothetical protein
MGLDVYLYRYSNFVATREIEEGIARVQDKLWQRDDLSDDQKHKQCQEIERSTWEAAAARGITPAVQIEFDSPTHADNICKIGYFRSSYNGAGLNNVLHSLGLPNLYDIFTTSDDGKVEEYHHRPHWKLSRTRAGQLLENLKAMRADPMRRLRAHFEGVSLLGQAGEVGTPQRAVELAREAIERHEKMARENPDRMQFFGGAYADKHGVFHPDPKDPLEVVALVRGAGEFSFQGPGFWVVYRAPENWLDTRIASVEVVIETIDYVLANPLEAPGEYVLHWSA